MGWFLFLIFFLIVATFAYASWRAAPWVPLHRLDVKRAVDLMLIEAGMIVYDLGAGDGRILEESACRGATSRGYEISLLPYLLARCRQTARSVRSDRNDYGSMDVRFRDFWFCNLQDADVVFLFLMPKVLPRMRRKLQQELKPGARVISYVWPIEGWTPKIINEVEGYPKLFVYAVDPPNSASKSATTASLFEGI